MTPTQKQNNFVNNQKRPRRTLNFSKAMKTIAESNHETTLVPLKRLWDCEYIGKSEKGWTCGWCNKFTRGLSLTRAISHLTFNQYGESQIKSCSVGRMNPLYRQRYLTFASKYYGNKYQKKQNAATHMASIGKHTATLANHHSGGKNEYTGVSPNYFNYSSLTEMAYKKVKLTTEEHTPPNMIQLHLDPGSGESFNPNNHVQLDMAIADMIHAHGLPFLLAESPRLKNVIRLARHCRKDYSLPSRTSVGGSLLDKNYDVYEKSMYDSLNKSQSQYGLSILGDGATIKKMPLFNILVASASDAPWVLGVVDCHKYIARGFIKNHTTIAKSCIPYMEKIDPDKRLIDLIMFDGASNMVKAGSDLCTIFPRATVIHGAEHIWLCFVAMCLSYHQSKQSFKSINFYIEYLELVQDIQYMLFLPKKQEITIMDVILG